MPRPAGTRVLFVAGLGRSGSTLMERIVGEVDGVTALGEVVHLWQRGLLDDERCGCGEPFSRCPFWQQVGNVAFGGWQAVDAHHVLDLRSRVDRLRHLPALLRREPAGRLAAAVTEYTSYYRALYAAAREVSHAEVVVDSSKHTSLAYCLRYDRGVDLRVLHFVRDSRGVAYSWTKEVERPEALGAGELMRRYSPARSAALWNAHNGALEVLRGLGVPVLRLRYEDFLRSPRATVASVLDFAGLPGRTVEGLDDTGAVLHGSHTVAGNPMRFTTGRITLRQDVAWRTHMPRGQQRAVLAATSPLLLHYGYLRSSPKAQ